MTFAATPNATSSPGSVCGLTRSAAPDGPTTAPCGPEAAPASPSAPQENSKGSTTPATSGLSGSISSASAALQLSLESRLRRRSVGSILYRLTWKTRVTPQGRPISALRASPGRTSASDFTSSGWVTASARDWKDTPGMALTRSDGRSRVDQLPRQPALAGWPTPTTGNASGSQMAKDASSTGRRPDGSKATVSLPQVASFSVWPTPMAGTPAQNGNNAAGNTDSSRRTVDAALSAPQRLSSDGTLSTGCSAGMASGGRLDPAHSRWLMRLPGEWDDCVPTATRSTPKRRPSSAEPSPT